MRSVGLEAAPIRVVWAVNERSFIEVAAGWLNGKAASTMEEARMTLRHRLWAPGSGARSLATGLMIGTAVTLVQIALLVAALLYAGILAP